MKIGKFVVMEDKSEEILCMSGRTEWKRYGVIILKLWPNSCIRLSSVSLMLMCET